MFKDKRVRQAMSYAINKQEIVDGVLRGFGKICIGPYKPGTVWENPNVNRYPYNPEKARTLLAEAGWEDTDGDGILDKDGKPFHFAIATNQGNKLRQDTAEIIQQRLKGIGIDVDIRIMEWSTFVYEFINKRTFEAVLLGWSTSPEPDQYDIWHSSKTAPEELNFVSYNNPEMDRLLVEGRRTFDKDKRIEIYRRICEILSEDQPYTFLYVPESLVSISSRFYGIKPAPAGLTYNMPKWYVPKSQQKYTLMP
jgi:peptide/nickel transport system substrate-binding protein